jgi:hypothetical protein
MPGWLGGREMWGMVSEPCVVDEWGFEKGEMDGWAGRQDTIYSIEGLDFKGVSTLTLGVDF